MPPGRAAAGQPAGRGAGGRVRVRNVIGRLGGHRPASLVSGNAGNGVTLLGGTRHNLAIRNFIGLSRLRHPLPNTGHAALNLGHFNRVAGNRS